MKIKSQLIISLAKLLFLSGFTSPSLRGSGRFSIATFHRVLPEAERQAYPYPGLVVTPEELDTLLSYFTRHFDCGALSTQFDRYLSGNIPSRPLLAITFDDAQYDNFINARPILSKHKLKASFFAPVEAVEKQELLWHDRLGFAIMALLSQKNGGQEKLFHIISSAGFTVNNSQSMFDNVVQFSKSIPLEARLRLVEDLKNAAEEAAAPEFARLMTFNELAELAREGHEIGSHSMTHCLMPECDDIALAYELSKSRRVLQTNLGQPIDSFCYPNGNSDSRTAAVAAKAGYRMAVTTTWGSNNQDSDRFRLNRYDMDARRSQDEKGNFVPALLAFRMSGFYPGLS